MFAICTTLTFFLWNTFYYALYHTRYTVCCTNINILLTCEEPWTRFLSKHVSLLKDQWVCLLQTLVEIIMHLLFLFFSFFLSILPSVAFFWLTLNYKHTNTHTPYSFCSSRDIGRPISAACITGPVWKTGPAQLTTYQRILNELYSSLRSAR